MATVIRLRSRLLRSGCSHTSPNRTSSRSWPSLGMNSYTVGFAWAMCPSSIWVASAAPISAEAGDASVRRQHTLFLLLRDPSRLDNRSRGTDTLFPAGDIRDMDTEAVRDTGWLRATTPLWPLALARIVYGLLWWQQSKWKVPSDDFGRKSGGGL